MLADEGAASVSDENGDLLFYTNGVTVFNKQHKIMLNGDALNGNISSVQVAIVQVPGNDSIFYIFTTDAIENSYQRGYQYSIVNMKHDGGNGEVTTRNVVLTSSCTERLTTARHANGTDVWLITNDNNSNIFRSWLINCTGLQLSPVISTAGNVLDLYTEMNTGILKVSPNGRMLCQTHFPYVESATHPPNYFQVFDFDNITGIISNARSIGFPDAQYTHCEFSSNSKLLYLTRPYDKKVDQLMITLPTVAAIKASRTVITTLTYYDIQLAPDEKIYLSQPGIFLGVIDEPNIPGAGCNLIKDAVNVVPGGSFIGLPSHINDMVASDDPNNGFTYTILDSCSGTVQFNAYSSISGTVTYEWDFGDGASSTLQNPLHVFTPAGSVYTVKLKIGSAIGCGRIFRSARIKPSGIISTQPDFEFIVRCDSGYIRFINKTTGTLSVSTLFTWDFGDGTFSNATDPVHTYAGPGTYPVQLKLSTGLACLDQQITIPVSVKDFTVVAPPDQTIMAGQSVLLSTESPASNFQWSPSNWLSNPGIRNPVATPLEDITYKVNASNGDGCKGVDSISIHVIQYNDIYVPSAFTPNSDGRNDRIKPFIPGNYELKEFSVFDRWGQRIFSSSQRGDSWDGKKEGITQGTGVYVWILRLTDKNGNKLERNGVFTLIR